jgi:guanosine-3',5'-bis(diphosphate) 3'-pyrophosphohydrolase
MINVNKLKTPIIPKELKMKTYYNIPYNMLPPLYARARTAAILAHESIGQVRKFSKRPYYTHPIEVSELACLLTKDEDVLAAACLHDILEDVMPKNPAYNTDWIRLEFNQRVLNIVVDLTNVFTKESHPELNRATRKALEKERILRISNEAKLIKICDLHHNNREVDENDPFTKIWREEKAELEKVLGGSLIERLATDYCGGLYDIGLILGPEFLTHVNSLKY